MINSKMSLAVRSALGLAAVASAMSAGLAFGQDAEVNEIEEIMVTGSRIARADLEGSNPVTVIDRTQMLRTGAPSVGEILQNLPSSAGGAVNTLSLIHI